MDDARGPCRTDLTDGPLSRSIAGMSDHSGGDPSQVVARPVERALGALILLGLASFVLSILAVLLAHERGAGPAHEGAHFALLVVMALVVFARAIQLIRNGGRSDADAWRRARDLHRSDTAVARVLTLAVPLAWLGGSVSIVMHHVPALAVLAPFAGALAPLAATLWILATFAWYDLCTERIGRALEESDRRYREYWRNIATR